jgi:hypothetical protein
VPAHRHHWPLPIGLGTLALVWACGSGPKPYNELEDFRLLAVRAQPPALASGGAAVLDALTYDPQGGTPSFAWSFCPLRNGTQGGYECAISESDFLSFLASAGLPTTGISYDLGTQPTAAFSYNLDPRVLGALCGQAVGAAGSTSLLDCSLGFPASVGLSVTEGQKTITAFKTLYLALDATSPLNQNPTLNGVSIAAQNKKRSDATPLDPSAPSFTATFGKSYELFADVPESSAESFFGTTMAGIPPSNQREVLTLTWFVNAGSTDYQHTNYYDGIADFDRLDHNTWTLPQPEQYASDHAELFLVLRDNRGGAAWLSRQILLALPQ